jgi:hypothetical protein
MSLPVVIHHYLVDPRSYVGVVERIAFVESYRRHSEAIQGVLCPELPLLRVAFVAQHRLLSVDAGAHLATMTESMRYRLGIQHRPRPFISCMSFFQASSLQVSQGALPVPSFHDSMPI